MNLLAATDRNWAIGNKGKLLVKIPNDQRFFQEMTKGKVIVLGRKTLSEFPNGLPLVGRTNVILSRNTGFQAKNAIIVHSEEELFQTLSGYHTDDIYVVGGSSIYHMLLPYCKVAHITKIDYAYQADTYFPNLDELENWEITADSEEQTYFDLEYIFLRYENQKVKG